MGSSRAAEGNMGSGRGERDERIGRIHMSFSRESVIVISVGVVYEEALHLLH